MKPTSIIFLILSIILIAFGIGLCFVAENMSKTQEIDIYSQSVDEFENNVERYDLTMADISRISLTLEKANVNILTNSDSQESYIELINFSKNTYEFSLSLQTVSVDDTVSLLSILNFAEGGFKFEGLRYYLTLDKYKDKQKIVNIYVSETNELKVIDISIGEGNLLIGNIINRIDYTLNIEVGDVELHKIRSSSIFNLNVDRGNAELVETQISNCLIEIGTGDLTMSVANYSNQNYDIITSLGNIYFGEEGKGGAYSQTIPIASTKTIANIGTGDVYITNNEVN